MLGRFLELGIHTPDVVESLGFYKLLGFHELEVGDVWSHKYAVVSDGEICIGLHDLPDEASPALTFVHKNVAKEARSMADHGFEFDQLQVDQDSFNQLTFRCQDGHTIKMIEARTFSRPDAGA